MNRLLPVLLAGTWLLMSESAAPARLHRGKPAPTSAAEPILQPDSSLHPEAAGAAAGSATPTSATPTSAAPLPTGAAPPTGLAPGSAPPPPAYGVPAAPYGTAPGLQATPYGVPPGAAQPGSGLPPPLPVLTRTRKYWELSAIGGIVLGGVYVASVLAGSISYAGFYQGQWGFFVPLVGPALTLGNVGGQVCPCFASQLYAYSIGTVLSLATIGAIVPIILGGVLAKNVPLTSSKVQLAPTLARDAGGFQLVGRF